MIIKETTPFGRIFHRWLYVLAFTFVAGLVASGSAFADHSPGHKGTSGGKGNNSPVIEDHLFSLDENGDLGTLVGTVVATSTKKNTTLEFAIAGGDDTGSFLIDQFGVLTTAAPLDHETIPAHILTVQVTDKFGSSTGTVTVEVADVNEAPTVNDGSFAVSELTAIGTVVKTVLASDPDDSSKPFGTLTYLLAFPSSGPILFEIDPTTGELTTIADLDHETVPSVIVTVVVVDGDDLSDFANFTVTIEDANEAPVATDTTFDVSELLPVGAIVGTVPASDPDNSAPYNTLSYAITGGNVGSAFNIDSATGELSTLAALDFDVTPSYNLTVEVTDGGGLSNTASVTVNVSDAVVPTNVSEIDGTNGFALIRDGVGLPVAIVGDVNGDGIDDFAVSAPQNDVGGNLTAGSVYIVFGTSGVSPPEFDLEALAGDDGFRFDGTGSNDFTGEFMINGAGDINNDGFADILIPALNAFNEENNSVGRVYVVFGGPQFPAVVSAADLNGVNGFRVINDPADSSWAFGLSSAGDINGDGIDDFAIGAVNATIDGILPQTGKVYAIFGRDIPNSEPDFDPVFDLTNLDASTGVFFYGALGDGVGLVLTPTGDLNVDGFGDFIISAIDGGRAYVVFGNLDLGSQDPVDPPVAFDLTTLDGTNGFIINGVFGELLGGGNGGGDINGDGHSDAVISAPGENRLTGETQVGAAYVIFGGPGIDWGSFDLTSLNGANGFKILGAAAFDALGYPLDNRSDIDGDGFDDIVAGARIAVVPPFPEPGEDPPPPPPILYYLIAGSDQPYPALIDLINLDPSMGNMIQAPAHTESMGAGGDVNGDGVDDFILSSGRDDLGNDTPAYVVFGGDF